MRIPSVSTGLRGHADGLCVDHVQITALSRALRVNISVAYLDGRAHGSQEGQVDFVQFHNTDEVDTDPVILLYRYVLATMRAFTECNSRLVFHQTWTL